MIFVIAGIFLVLVMELLTRRALTRLTKSNEAVLADRDAQIAFLKSRLTAQIGNGNGNGGHHR
jgi:hypothetical protein